MVFGCLYCHLSKETELSTHHQMRKYILLLITVVLLASCGNKTAQTLDGGDTIRMKYSSLLTLVSHHGYTVAVVKNPWKSGKVLHTYVLVPRGQKAPETDKLPDNATIVETPVRRAAVFTTVHCSLLDMLQRKNCIVAVADVKYIKLPFIQQQVKKGKITDCGSGLQPVVERIMDVKPDVIMLSPFENSGGYGKTEELGIPIIECADYMERSPLACAEWMKFYGMLFGAEKEADNLFATVDNSYQNLCRQARQAGPGRSVIIDKMVGNVWYMPGGKSTIGQMVKDAGGQYPWANDDHSGSLSLSLENVLEKGGDADAWLFRYSSNKIYATGDLLAERSGYSQMNAFKTGELYGCNVEKTLFYEETPFHPDYLLADFIHILHPNLKTTGKLRYFQKLK